MLNLSKDGHSTASLSPYSSFSFRNLKAYLFICDIQMEKESPLLKQSQYHMAGSVSVLSSIERRRGGGKEQALEAS